MNKIPLYQHPFVDVFRVIKVADWKTAAKEGDVTEAMDKKISKKVIKIGGATSASNYIQVLGSKSTMKSLGLTGKFAYVLFQWPVGKQYSFHLDFVVNE